MRRNRSRSRERVLPGNADPIGFPIPNFRNPGHFGMQRQPANVNQNHRPNLTRNSFVEGRGNHVPHRQQGWRGRTSDAATSSDRRNYHGNQNRRGGGNFRNESNNYQRGTAPRNDNRQQQGRRPMGFKALENLLEKSPEDLMLDLSNSRRGFSEYLQTNLTDDAIVLFVKILRKVCDSHFLENKYKVLQTYFDDPFNTILTNYITQLPLQEESQKRKNSYFWNNTDEFWNNVLAICGDILDTMPTFAAKVLPKILKGLHLYLPTFEEQHNRHISDEIKENVKKLFDIVQTMVEENEEREKQRVEKRVSHQIEEEPPPDDFRQISVYPNSHELVSNTPVYLRANVVKGPYRDVDHYLDVQFRLLREDFVRPLRTGIACYRSETKKKAENVKIYKKVRFLNPETINESCCIRLQFDFTQKKKNFRYENSRRFMFGSLLCFTNDNFRTFIFGKVAERKTEDLEMGQLIVGFDENVNVSYQTDYVMIECSVYFEPYFHVLNVLKEMPLENFPMERYIIRVNPSIKPPEYLADAGCYQYRVDKHELFPLIDWPTRRYYDLNEAQLTAFKAALTQEFAIIQGPPGTGKTFLGLKIAKTLLENKEVWYQKTPMLVICFTNHALDQFLEGILHFTQSIMRVGGQSKNEVLKNFNLRNKSKFKMNPAVFEQRDNVQRIYAKVKGISENLKHINFYHSVRDFGAFSEVVPNYRDTWFYRATKAQIQDWLFGGREGNSKFTLPAREQREVVENKLTIGDENNSDDSEDDPDPVDDLQFNDDDIFEDRVIIDADKVQCSVPLVTLTSIASKIGELENILVTLKRKWEQEPPTFEELIQEENSQNEYIKLVEKHDYLKMRLAEGKQSSNAPVPRIMNVDLKNPHSMKADDRWKLYFHWLRLYEAKLNEKMDLLNRQFREEFKIYEGMRDMENVKQMRNVLVIGMTTTGAARLRTTLQTLKSPIVIVEEAAEVLEAHIVTSITKHCKHLILIGDHQQLKPSTADYNIEKNYSLGISLFERMVLNNIQCYTLNVQHRMIPSIADLIRPTIYPNLEDHPSVLERQPIRGVDNNLYFIDHKHTEEDCEGTSKKNFHEVEFLIAFARHLILNGYLPEKITILAAYLGQMFEMQKEKKKHKNLLEKVRISVLDNYQGEECDIILLSLVRSNKDNKIGFLSIENRVCVALSRARDGLYVMGNMAQLCSASQLWGQIRRTLEAQNALGPELPLRCQVHRTITLVQKGSDFLSIPEGGCAAKCEADLACGHKCTSFCHILNQEHKDYRCRTVCRKRLCDFDDAHICKKLCYQECGPCDYKVPRKLPCGHDVSIECHIDPDKYECEVPVETTLPCGHVADKPCHRDPMLYRCPHPCDTMVEPCGHSCVMLCHVRKDPDHLEYKCRKPCAKYRKGCTVQSEQHLCRKYCYEECDECTIKIKKARTVCPHFYDVPCCSNVDEIICTKPCTKRLACGHKCKNKCNESCGLCEVKVDKVIPICRHSVRVKCSEEPDRALCKKKCPLKLPCGHPCTKKCNEACTTDCKVMVDCLIKPACGHTATKIPCHLSNSDLENANSLLKYCNEPCNYELKCGHKCSGSCGGCYQGRVHKRCTENCGVPLVCDHLCEFPCRQACRPCAKNCPYRCKHSNCRKKCGEVCTPCKEKCSRRCSHQTCTKPCGDICNVPPCNEPCGNRLKCGHPCVGFCGDPCPPKCMVCDNAELTVIFFGNEDDEDARFIVLEDCGHVFESEGLEQWLGQDADQISFKTCPQCKTPIKTTQRFSDQIKTAMADVAKVKAQSNGTLQENDQKRNKLLVKLHTLKATSGILSLLCPKLKKVWLMLENRLVAVRKGKRQPINKYDLNALTSKLQIIEHMIKICCNNNVQIRDSNEIFFPQVKFISKILLREEDFITDQEIDDVNFELNRLSRIVEYSRLKKSPTFVGQFGSNDKVKRVVKQIEALIFGWGKFYEHDEEKVRELLKDLSKALSSGIGISESEKREIVRAMGFSKGHWYKCPNGHPYIITECGGAMQVSKCPECNAPIGGSHHLLLASNAVATEMDGARHGAWTEAANMANFDLRNLF